MGRVNPNETYRSGTTGFNMAAICDCLYAIKGYVATEDAQAVAAVILDPLPPPNSLAAGCTDWRRRTGIKASKPPVLIQNGIQKPRPGKCLDIWNAADELRDKMAGDYKAINAHIQAEAEARGFNLGNVKTEMSRWKRFHSMG